MRYLKKIKILIFTSILISCDFCKVFNHEESLGSNFSLIEENILYCTSQSCCNIGFPVIPPKIREVRFNDQWIIVKSIQKVNVISYWIIDKEFDIDLDKCAEIKCDSIIKANVFGPFLQKEFLQKKDSLNIDLSLL
jgi:hypothetical protein